MKIRRFPALWTIVALAACGGSASDPGDDVAEVRITPEAPSIDVGLSVPFTARAYDAQGREVGGLETTWASSKPSVATITTDGVATAIEQGTTSITATMGGKADSEVLTVNPSQCTDRVDVILDPGQFQSYQASQCLLLPSGASGDRYVVAVVRNTQISDSMDVRSVTLKLDPIFATAEQVPDPRAVAGQPLPVSGGPVGLDPSLPRLDGSRWVEDVRTREATRRFHEELRQRELDLGLELVPVLPSRPALAAPQRVDPPARADMYLGVDCDVTTLSPVRLIDFSDDLVIYQDSVEWLTPADRLTTAMTQPLLAYHTDYVRDMVAAYWGTPSDIDGNERVIIVTSSGLPENAAAGVFSGDLVDSSSCAGSNEGEVIYFSRDVIADLDNPNPDDVSYLALSVLAHELKHVVSLYNGLARGRFHPTWIEEGTAEISQMMSSRIAWAATGGPAVGSAVTGNDIISFVQENNGEVTPELWGVIGGLADLIVNLSTQPNSLITNPTGRNEFHTFYAASWHWHRLIGDAYGNAASPLADAPVFKELTDSLTPSGVSGLMSVTGRTFNEMFEDLIVAASVHGTAQGATREFTTWDFVTATNIFQSPEVVAPPGVYPWPVTGDDGGPSASFSSSRSYTSQMGASGVRFHDFVSFGTGLGAQILVTGAPGGTIVVTRLR